MRKVKTISAKQFKDKNGTYIFPFKVIDKQFGRIEWHIEPIKGRKSGMGRGLYYIETLLVWATQTRDVRYLGKTFEIPCFTEAIVADSLRKSNSYFHYVWRMIFCDTHKTVSFSAYPANEHKTLEINVDSSISSSIEFK